MDNSNDVNKYYDVINTYIDNFLEKWKIKPENLKRYMIGKNKAKLEKFIQKKGLENISRINTIIEDVINDRVNLHNDSIMKFENFKLFESESNSDIKIGECIYKGVDKATIEHEKILADFFDLSLSQIDFLSSDEHLFNLDILNGIKVIIYNNDDLQIIKENIKIFIKQSFIKKVFNLNLNDSKNDNLNLKLSLNLENILNLDNLEKEIENTISKVGIKNIIIYILNIKSSVQLEDTNDSYFIGIFK